MEYLAYLHKDRDSDFGVSFPDFPGCVTAGKTLEESRRNAQEALALHIAGMAEDGEAIPEPSTLDAIASDPAIRDAVAILVNVDSEKRVRVNITAKESQIEKIDRLAQQAGMTRSAYFVQAAIHGVANPSEDFRFHRGTRIKKAKAKRIRKAAHATRKQRVIAERDTHKRPRRDPKAQEHAARR